MHTVLRVSISSVIVPDLDMKSVAPSDSALFLSDVAFDVVKIMTGMERSDAFSRISVRTWKPFFLGRLRLSRIRSGLGAS